MIYLEHSDESSVHFGEIRLEGLQEQLTDFHAWVAKFNRSVERSKHIDAMKTSKNNDEGKEEVKKIEGVSRLQDLYVQGIPLMVSWGDAANPPVLMVHGYMDTVATFDFLIEYLPETFYYVGFDMPGHGRSDPLPPGLLLSFLHMVETIRRAVEYLKWEKFVCFNHSAGFLCGIYYNAVFPGKITKFVNIDATPTFSLAYHTTHYPQRFMQRFYNKIYEKYNSYYNDTPKSFTYEEIVKLTAKNRNLSMKQAEVTLSRSLVQCADGKYKHSLDPRMRVITGLFIPEETLLAIVLRSPPSLFIVASEYLYKGSKDRTEGFVLEFIEKIRTPICYLVNVQGGHDVHITDPKAITPYIVDFLNRDVTCNFAQAKL